MVQSSETHQVQASTVRHQFISSSQTKHDPDPKTDYSFFLANPNQKVITIAKLNIFQAENVFLPIKAERFDGFVLHFSYILKFLLKRRRDDNVTGWKRLFDDLLFLPSGNVVGFRVALPLLPDAVEPLVSTGLANGSPHVVTLHVLCDLHGPDSAGLHLQGHHGADHLAGLVHVLKNKRILSLLECW